MRSFIIALALASAVSGQVAQPSFSWEDDGQQAIPLLRVRFHDGQEDDYAVLSAYNPIPQGRSERLEDIDNCIYHGYLKKEADVYVTLTGGCANSNTFDIQFRSSRTKNHMFSVVNGQTIPMESIFGQRVFDRSGNFTMIKDRAVEVPASIARLAYSPGSERGLNPRGYLLRIRMRYDENFAAKFGADAVNTARRIIAQAQNIWKWTPSLGTSVQFQVANNVDPIKGRYVADTDLEKVSKLSTDDVDANVFLAFRNNQPGTVGIAWTGAVCYDAFHRTSLNEYFQNDLKAGETIAHEIGHNLGMRHDFDNDPKNKRNDSKGRPCSGVGGVMDYYGNVNKWSPCSVEDFTKLVDSTKNFCLKTL